MVLIEWVAMPATWKWSLRTLDPGFGDKDSGNVSLSYAPSVGGSVQRVILSGGIYGFLGINHAAPGAARIPAIYQWTYSLTQSTPGVGTRTIFRRVGPAVTTGYTVDTASGTTTTSMMTWTMPPEWWQFDADVRFSGASGASLTLHFQYSDLTRNLAGVDQPTKAWAGWVDMNVLESVL